MKARIHVWQNHNIVWEWKINIWDEIDPEDRYYFLSDDRIHYTESHAHKEAKKAAKMLGLEVVE